jgi:hypothetical protein
MAKHMAWTVAGDLIITVHDERAPADDEWRSWIRDFEGNIERLRAVVVHSLGGGPTSSQRKELLNVINRSERVPATVIMTSSALMRGLVTAIGWFLPPERRATMFKLDEIGPAFDCLGLDASARSIALTELNKLRASLTGAERVATSGPM